MRERGGLYRESLPDSPWPTQRRVRLPTHSGVCSDRGWSGDRGSTNYPRAKSRNPKSFFFVRSVWCVRTRSGWCLPTFVTPRECSRREMDTERTDSHKTTRWPLVPTTVYTDPLCYDWGSRSQVDRRTDVWRWRSGHRNDGTSWKDPGCTLSFYGDLMTDRPSPWWLIKVYLSYYVRPGPRLRVEG